MKKLVFGLMLLSGIAYAACQGPYCYDDKGATINSQLGTQGPLKPFVGTKAQIAALTPDATGYLVVCLDCTVPRICISTAGVPGTGSFVLLNSTVGSSGLVTCQ